MSLGRVVARWRASRPSDSCVGFGPSRGRAPRWSQTSRCSSACPASARPVPHGVQIAGRPGECLLDATPSSPCYLDGFVHQRDLDFDLLKKGPSLWKATIVGGKVQWGE